MPGIGVGVSVDLWNPNVTPSGAGDEQDNLLKEDGDSILQENGDLILLETGPVS